ncbi:MAG: hypothetical protein FJZ56_07230 [Chlamydiae bacterium]|nr:hypothetical protein [Chlamydiota bacterium]
MKMKALEEVEDVIAKAIKKVGGNKENDLCKFIPASTGGYMHHFTLKKLKNRKPSELSTLIEKFIISPSKPVVIAPKQRAARGSRKRRDQMMFTKFQLERLLNIARLAGDKEMISVLSPKKSLATYKRELIQSIRQNIADQELWTAYCESIQAHNALINSTQFGGLDLGQGH